MQENCPCCRHAASAFEMLPNIDDQDEEEDDDEEEVDDVFESYIDMAAQERAIIRFSRYRREMTTDEFLAFAATKISSCVRGFFARKSYDDHMASYIKMEKAIIRRAKSRIEYTNAKVRAALHSKNRHMSRPQWVSFMATYIQTWWRERKNIRKMRRDAENAAINAALAKGLIITWKRVSETRWERIVLNPEERDAQTFNGYLTHTPPQSLAFEAACAATKIAAVWRGYHSRKVSGTARYLTMLQNTMPAGWASGIRHLYT